MSKHRLDKNCHRDEFTPSNRENFSRTPVVIGDSKVRYLKPFATSNTIICVSKSGANSSVIFTWIHRNIRKLLKKHKLLCIYLFCGTCDFTEKRGCYNDLRSIQSEVLQRFCNNLQGIKEICYKFGSLIKLAYLQVLYYSIQHWNRAKGHPEPEAFKDNDLFLNSQIDQANQFIETLNYSVNAISPKLNEDLKSRKRKGGEAYYSLNLKLYKDWIHPDSKLAKSWYTWVFREVMISHNNLGRERSAKCR